MPGRMRRWGMIAALVTWFAPAISSGQTCPEVPGATASLADRSAAERYAFIESTLDREARKGRIWNHAWGWGFLGVTIGQAGVGAWVSDENCPECWYVGAAKSGLGLISTVLLKPVVVDRVDPIVEPTCDDLARAERLLIAAANSERVHWFRHVEGGLVNLAAVLYLGLEHDEWGKALLGAAIGTAVGEYRLYSRPDGAIDALRDYRAGSVGGRADAHTQWMLVPAVGDDGFGLSLIVGF